MLSGLIAEGRALVEAADAIPTKSFASSKLSFEIADAFRKVPGARKSGVLYVYWKDPTLIAQVKDVGGDWSLVRNNLPAKILSYWEHTLLHDIHNKIDSDWNDGEPYDDNDPTSIWPDDVRKWYRAVRPKLAAIKVVVSDIVTSPKTGLPGFKVTVTPALASLPKYTGKSKLVDF